MSDEEYELAFSTTKDVKKKKGKQSKTKKNYVRSKGPIKMRIEKKGRGGKTVTILFDIPLDEPEAKALMKKLQSHLACGGALKNGVIELNGDNREKVESFLKKEKNLNK